MTCCRTYHVLTREEVEAHVIPTVEQIPGSKTFNNPTDFHRSQWNRSGVSQFKQAFSTGTDGSILVRKKPCACAACIDQDWENCALKVHFFVTKLKIPTWSWFPQGHVDKPVLLVLKQKESKKKVQIYCQKSLSLTSSHPLGSASFSPVAWGSRLAAVCWTRCGLRCENC